MAVLCSTRRSSSSVLGMKPMVVLVTSTISDPTCTRSTIAHGKSICWRSQAENRPGALGRRCAEFSKLCFGRPHVFAVLPVTVCDGLELIRGKVCHDHINLCVIA